MKKLLIVSTAALGLMAVSAFAEKPAGAGSFGQSRSAAVHAAIGDTTSPGASEFGHDKTQHGSALNGGNYTGTTTGTTTGTGGTTTPGGPTDTSGTTTTGGTDLGGTTVGGTTSGGTTVGGSTTGGSTTTTTTTTTGATISAGHTSHSGAGLY